MTGHSLAIIGLGRMGTAVAAQAGEHGWTVTATIAAAGNASVTKDALHGATVAIEFTDAAAAPGNIQACVAAGCPIVVGTTGWYDQLPAISAAVMRAGGAMLWAPNFSVGANVLLGAAAHVARVLRASRASFDAHIVETHHAAKRDAPSGTALAIERAVEVPWREPVAITSIRVGSVPGVHEIVFDAAYEQLSLGHTVRDRRVFAEGALVAAAWLVGRRGVFTMQDVLAEGQA